MAGQQCLLCNDTVITQVQTDEMLRAAKVGFVLMFQKQEPEAAGGRRSARLAGAEKKQPVTRREEKESVIEISDDEEPVLVPRSVPVKKPDPVPVKKPDPVPVKKPDPGPVANTEQQSAGTDKKRTFAAAFFDATTRAAAGYLAGCALAVLCEAPAKEPAPEQDNEEPVRKICKERPLAPAYE